MSFSIMKLSGGSWKFYGLYFCSIRNQNHAVFPVLGRSSQREELVSAELKECLGHGEKETESIKLERFVSENTMTHLMSHTLKRSLALLRTEAAMRDDNLLRGALNQTLALITIKARQRPRH